MVTPLGTLLQSSIESFTRQWKPILVGAVIFAAIMSAGQVFLMDTAMNSVPGPMGDLERMEELAERIEAGDEEAMNEMMKGMGMMGEDGAINEEAMEAMAKGFVSQLLPVFSGFVLVMMVLGVIASAYYFVLAINGSTDAMASLRETPQLILPFIGLSIWTFLRMFAWIPVIGVVFAIIIGPRLMCAPVILIKEKKGVFDSVRLSYERTVGHWGKIVGNLLVMALLLWLAIMVLGVVVGMVAEASLIAGAFLMGLIQWTATGFGTIFVVKLADTVMKNQLRLVKK